jgi:CheY-like chemotaxis protein
MTWRFLVVDNDPLLRALIRSHLAEYATEILEADAAEPALALLLTNSCDLLITDLQIPGEHPGPGFLERARDQRPELPIIGMAETLPEAPENRLADAHLVKPFHPDELLGLVLELLGR